MTVYYTYDAYHGVFESSTRIRKIANPKKLKYTQLVDVCWTDFEEAQRAVVGVLLAKVEHLHQVIADTSDEIRRVGDFGICHDCEEILPDDDVNEYTIARIEVYLCGRCFKARGEH